MGIICEHIYRSPSPLAFFFPPICGRTGEHWIQNHIRILESKLALVDPQHQQLILEYRSSDVSKEIESRDLSI